MQTDEERVTYRENDKFSGTEGMELRLLTSTKEDRHTLTHTPRLSDGHICSRLRDPTFPPMQRIHY